MLQYYKAISNIICILGGKHHSVYIYMCVCIFVYIHKNNIFYVS